MGEPAQVKFCDLKAGDQFKILFYGGMTYEKLQSNNHIPMIKEICSASKFRWLLAEDLEVFLINNDLVVE